MSESTDLEGAEPPEREPGLSGFLRRLFTPAPMTQERVLGVVGLWCMMGEGHIVTIAVREAYRRQGIGELLLIAIMDTAQDAGQDGVTLEYRISNQGARKLYEKYGFMPVGRRARCYSHTQAAAGVDRREGGRRLLVVLRHRAMAWRNDHERNREQETDQRAEGHRAGSARRVVRVLYEEGAAAHRRFAEGPAEEDRNLARMYLSPLLSSADPTCLCPALTGMP